MYLQNLHIKKMKKEKEKSLDRGYVNFVVFCNCLWVLLPANEQKKLIDLLLLTVLLHYMRYFDYTAVLRQYLKLLPKKIAESSFPGIPTTWMEESKKLPYILSRHYYHFWFSQEFFTGVASIEPYAVCPGILVLWNDIRFHIL